MSSILPENEHTRYAAILLLSHAEAVNTPSNLLRPRLSQDGNKWCALYGDNIQDGVAGFGDSPALAYADFDRAWTATLVKMNPISPPPWLPNPK